MMEGAVRLALSRVTRRAGLLANGPHRLRHTFCSHLAMNGAPLLAIRALAGHASLSTTQRSMHLTPATLEVAIEQLERHRAKWRRDWGPPADQLADRSNSVIIAWRRVDAIIARAADRIRARGAARAIAMVRESRAGLPIEIEAQSLVEVDEALEAGADVVLADNLSIDDIEETVRRARGRARVEISGGVTLDRLPALARTGADDVSVGGLTHSAPAVDISFEIEAPAPGPAASPR
jgi:hypothetical protein